VKQVGGEGARPGVGGMERRCPNEENEA